MTNNTTTNNTTENSKTENQTEGFLTLTADNLRALGHNRSAFFAPCAEAPGAPSNKTSTISSENSSVRDAGGTQGASLEDLDEVRSLGSGLIMDDSDFEDYLLERGQGMGL